MENVIGMGVTISDPKFARRFGKQVNRRWEEARSRAEIAEEILALRRSPKAGWEKRFWRRAVVELMRAEATGSTYAVRIIR